MALSKIKHRVLLEIVQRYVPGTSSEISLAALEKIIKNDKRFSGNTKFFADYESVKIVGEEKVRYTEVIAVMDAARGFRSEKGMITMFPNVSIAGGIVQ